MQDNCDLTKELLLADSYFILYKGEFWMTSAKLGQVIGYSHPRIAINKIFQRHKFSLERCSALVKSDSNGGKQVTRIFNENGCQLIAIFARMKRAHKFKLMIPRVFKAMQSSVGGKAFKIIVNGVITNDQQSTTNK